MEAAVISTVIARIEAQALEIDSCQTRAEARALDLDASKPGTIEALAYQLHNLYNSVEDLLKLVANAFENHVEDSAAWHRGLIQVLSLTIEGVRPSLVSREAAEGLDELRRFRHFFRHAYGATLQSERVGQILKTARSVIPVFKRDVEAFVTVLRDLRDGSASAVDGGVTP